MLLFFLKRLRQAQSGATAIEYGLIAALVSIVIMAVLTTMGTSLVSLYDTVQSNLTSAASSMAP